MATEFYMMFGEVTLTPYGDYDALHMSCQKVHNERSTPAHLALHALMHLHLILPWPMLPDILFLDQFPDEWNETMDLQIFIMIYFVVIFLLVLNFVSDACRALSLILCNRSPCLASLFAV